MRIVITGMVLALLAGCSSETPAERDANNRRDQCESTVGANLMVREFVKDRLIAPTKAKFASHRNSSIAPTGGKCEFSVSSYVDAHNAFGATVRTKYSAVVKYNPDTDRWNLVKLDM